MHCFQVSLCARHGWGVWHWSSGNGGGSLWNFQGHQRSGRKPCILRTETSVERKPQSCRTRLSRYQVMELSTRRCGCQALRDWPRQTGGASATQRICKEAARLNVELRILKVKASSFRDSTQGLCSCQDVLYKFWWG